MVWVCKALEHFLVLSWLHFLLPYFSHFLCFFYCICLVITIATFHSFTPPYSFGVVEGLRLQGFEARTSVAVASTSFVLLASFIHRSIVIFHIFICNCAIYGYIAISSASAVDNCEACSWSIETPLACGRGSGNDPSPWACEICWVGRVRPCGLAKEGKIFFVSTLSLRITVICVHSCFLALDLVN